MRGSEFSVSSESFDRLPACDRALFSAPEKDLFRSLLWFETIARHAVAKDRRARCIIVRRAGVPQLALPVWCRKNGAITGSLSSHYSVIYRPLFAAGVDEHEAAHVFASFCQKQEILRFDELDGNDLSFAAIRRGFEDAKFWPLEFLHFGNWYQPLADRSFSAYLSN